MVRDDELVRKRSTDVYCTGDLVSFSVLGQSYVIVNSRKAAIEIFEKRARIYSDKPALPLLGLSGWSFNISQLSKPVNTIYSDYHYSIHSRHNGLR